MHYSKPICPTLDPINIDKKSKFLWSTTGSGRLWLYIIFLPGKSINFYLVPPRTSVDLSWLAGHAFALNPHAAGGAVTRVVPLPRGLVVAGPPLWIHPLISRVTRYSVPASAVSCAGTHSVAFRHFVVTVFICISSGACPFYVVSFYSRDCR